MIDVTMTIDGMAVRTEATLDVVNPATGKSLAPAPDAGAVELDRAIDAAHAALPMWRAMPWRDRQERVALIGQTLADTAPELVALLVAEQGKPVPQAEFEIMGAAQWCQAVASMTLDDIVVEERPGRKVVTRHVPIGVVGAISPWNFPVMLSIWKIAPALLTGNTMVLKPSPYTPLTVLRIGEFLRDILPKGVLNILSGGDALGPLMTAHPGFDKISFTGSTTTGRRVMESAAPTLKRLTLELGGNDPAIVFPDVDIDDMAEALFWSAFTNSGQICAATKRVYVHEEIYEPLLARLSSLVRSTPMGDGSREGIALARYKTGFSSTG